MRKVRIGATLRGAFDIVLNLRVLVGCAGGWSILLLAAMLIEWAFHAQLSWFGELANTAARLLAFVGMAVNVHRRVLLGESPRPFRIGRSEMRFAWRELVMGVFAVVVGLVLALIYYLGSYLLGIGLPGRILMVALCACVALFLMIEFIGSVLVLPAAAIDQASFRWSNAWEAAENNKLAILFLAMISTVPLALPSIGLLAVEPRLVLLPGGSLVAEVVRWMIAVAQSILNAAWISLVFSGLVDGNSDFAVISTDGSGDT